MSATWRKTIVKGMWAGVIGFFSVAAVFSIANLGTGRSPWYTSAVLGAALFHGATDPSQVTVSLANVLEYSVAHLLVFVCFGIAAAALATLANRGAQLWYVALYFLIFISFHLQATVQAFAAPMRPVIPETAIWIAGLAGSAAMGWYLLRAYPAIRRRQPWSG